MERAYFSHIPREGLHQAFQHHKGNTRISGEAEGEGECEKSFYCGFLEEGMGEAG